MDLAGWIEQKRQWVRRLTGLDLRRITPSIKDFTHAVTTHRHGLAVIAELARATPEEGPLAPTLDLTGYARTIDEAGGAAIAVATDSIVCQGSEQDLLAIAAATTTPVVAHDLVLTREQVYLARLAGADAVLLTAGAVSAGELRLFHELAASMHMAAPIEVRSEPELERALASGARQVVVPAFGDQGLDLSLADALLPKVPQRVTPILRGPFSTEGDLEKVRGRVDAIWVAGPFLRASAPGPFLKRLVDAADG